MAIEVRQMLIKSTVLSPAETARNGAATQVDVDEIKADILAACRQLLVEMLREELER